MLDIVLRSDSKNLVSTNNLFFHLAFISFGTIIKHWKCISFFPLIQRRNHLSPKTVFFYVSSETTMFWNNTFITCASHCFCTLSSILLLLCSAWACGNSAVEKVIFVTFTNIKSQITCEENECLIQIIFCNTHII